MESGSATLSTCVNALKGTAEEAAVVVAAFALEEDVAPEPTPDLMAFEGALSTDAEGV
jgi:hypothetical protein